jgi:protease-4
MSQVTGQMTRIQQRRTGPLILELDLTDGLAEGPPGDPVSAVLTMRRLRLPDMLEGLRRASRDDRVKVVVVKVGGSRIGLARIQELRSAIMEFRRSGKAAVAWAETFGEFTRGNLPYYLATAFDKIWLQPTGTLGLTGIAVARRAGQGGRVVRERQAARVQVRGRPAHRDRVHRAGPRGRRAAGGVGRRAGR